MAALMKISKSLQSNSILFLSTAVYNLIYIRPVRKELEFHNNVKYEHNHYEMTFINLIIYIYIYYKYFN